MSRHTKDVHSIKTRQLAVLNPDGSFPREGDVMTVADWRGSIQPSSDITLDSITAANISVTGPILQSTVVANTILSNAITTDDLQVSGLTKTLDISANNIITGTLSVPSLQSSCLTTDMLNTSTLSVVSVTADDISGGAASVTSITANKLVVTNLATVPVTTTDTLQASSVVAQRLNAGTVSSTYAKITDLSAQTVTPRLLNAYDISMGSVKVNNASVAQNLKVKNLKTSGIFTFDKYTVQDISSSLLTAIDISADVLDVKGGANISSVTANRLTVGQINVAAINVSNLSVKDDISASGFDCAGGLITGNITSTSASMNTINSLATLAVTGTAEAKKSISIATLNSTNTMRVSSDISLNGAGLSCVPLEAGLLVNGSAISSVWAMYPDQTPFNPLQISDLSSTMSGFINSFNRFLTIFSDRDIVIAVNPSYIFSAPASIQFLVNGVPSIVRFPIGNNYLDLMLDSLNAVSPGIKFSDIPPTGPTISWFVKMDVSANGIYAISDLSGSSSYYFSNLPMGSLQVMRYLGFTVDPFNNPFQTYQMGSLGLYSSAVKRLTGGASYYADRPLYGRNENSAVSAPNITFYLSDPYSISFNQGSLPRSTGTLYLSIFQAGRGYSLYPAVTGQEQKIYDLVPNTVYTITPIYLDDYTNTAAAAQALRTAYIPGPTVAVATTYNTIKLAWSQPYPGKIYTFDLSASGQFITPANTPLISDLSYTYMGLLRNSPYQIVIRSFDSSFNSYSQSSVLNISTRALTVPQPSIKYITNSVLRVSWTPPAPIDVSATLLFDYATLAVVPYVLRTGISFFDISGLADIAGLTDINDISCSLVYTDNLRNTVQGEPLTFSFKSTFGFDVSANAQYPLMLDNIDTIGLGYTLPRGSAWTNNIVNQIRFPGKGLIETTGNPATFVAKAYVVATSDLIGLYSRPPWKISKFTLPATPVATSDPITLVGGSTSNPTVFFSQAKFPLLADASSTTIVMFQLISRTGGIRFPTFSRQSPIQDISASALTLDSSGNLTNGFYTSLNGIACVFNYENSYSEPEFTLTAPTPYDISFSLASVPSEIDSILVDICGSLLPPYPNTWTESIAFTTLTPNTSYTITVSYVRPFYTTTTTRTIRTLPIPPPQINSTQITINSIALSWNISYNANYSPPRYIYRLDASGNNTLPPYISPSTIQIYDKTYAYNSLLQNVTYTIILRTYDTSYNLYSTSVVLPITTRQITIPTPVLRRGPSNTNVTISFSVTPTDVSGSVNYFLGSSTNKTKIPIPAGATSLNISGFTTAVDIRACDVSYTDGINNNISGIPAATFYYDPSFGFFDATPAQSPIQIANNNNTFGYTFPANSPWIGYTLTAMTFPSITVIPATPMAISASIYDISTSLLAGLYTASSNFVVNNFLFSAPVATSNIVFLNGSSTPTIRFPSAYTIRNPTTSGKTSIIMLKAIAGSASIVFSAFTSSVYTTAAALTYTASNSILLNNFGYGATGLICQFTWLTPPPQPLAPAISVNGVTSPTPYSLRYVLTNLSPPTTSYVSYTYVLYPQGQPVQTINALTFYGTQSDISVPGFPPNTPVTNMVLYYSNTSNGTAFTTITSNPKTISISGPRDLSSTDVTINSIDISWNPSLIGNNIQYGTRSNPISDFSFSSATTRRFGSLTNNTDYSISVVARDSNFTDPIYYSEIVTLPLTRTNPLTFSAFTIYPTPASNDKLTIQWVFGGSTRGYPDASGTLVLYKEQVRQPDVTVSALTISPYIGSYIVSGLTADINDISASLFFTDGSMQNTTAIRTASTQLGSQFGFYDASDNATNKLILNSTLRVGYAFPSRSDLSGYTFNALTLTQGLVSFTNPCAIMANIYDIPNGNLNLYSGTYKSTVTLPTPTSSSYIYFTGTGPYPTLYFPTSYTIRNPSFSPVTTVVLLQIIAGNSTVLLRTFTNGLGGYDISKNATSVVYDANDNGATTISNAFTNWNGRSTICQFFNLSAPSLSVPPTPALSAITAGPYDISYNLTNLGSNRNYVSYTSPSATLLSNGTTNPVILTNLIPNTVYRNLTAYYQGLPYTSSITVPETTTALQFYASSLLNNGDISSTRIATPTIVSQSSTINSISLSWNPITYPGRIILYDVSGTGFTGQKIPATSCIIPGLIRGTPYNINVYAYDTAYPTFANYSLPLTVARSTVAFSVTNPTVTYVPNSNTVVRVAWTTTSNPLTSDPLNPIVGTVNYSLNRGSYIPKTSFTTVNPTSFYYDIPGFTQRTDVSGYVNYKDTLNVNNFNSSPVATFVADPSFGFFNYSLSSIVATLNTGSSVGYVVLTNSPYIGYTFNSVTFLSDISGTVGRNLAIVANVYEILTTNLAGLYSPGSGPVTVGSLTNTNASATSYIYFLTSAAPVKPTLMFPTPYIIGKTTGYSTVILFQVIAGTGNVTVPTTSPNTNFTSVTYVGNTMTNVPTGGAICQFNYVPALTSIPEMPAVTRVTSPTAYSLEYELGNQGSFTTYASLITLTSNMLYAISPPNQISNLIPSTTYSSTVYYVGTGTVYATSKTTASSVPTSQLPAPTITFPLSDVSFNAITVNFAMPAPYNSNGKTYLYKLIVSPNPSVPPPSTVTSPYTLRYLKNNTSYVVNVTAYDSAYATQLSAQGSASKTTLPLTVTTPVITPVANTNTEARITWSPVLPTGYAGVLATGTLYYNKNGVPVVPGSPYTIPVNTTTSPLITGLNANDIITSYVRYQGTGETINDVSSAVASLTFVSSFGFADASANASSRITLTPEISYGYTFPSGSGWIGKGFDAITFSKGIDVIGGPLALVAKLYSVPFASFTSLYQPSYQVTIALTPTYTSNIAFLDSGIQTPTLYFSQLLPAISKPTDANYTVLLLQIVAGSGIIEIPTYNNIASPNTDKGYNINSTSLMYENNILRNLFDITTDGVPNKKSGIICTFNDVPQNPAPVMPNAPIVTPTLSPYSLTYGLTNWSTTYTNYVSYTIPPFGINILRQYYPTGLQNSITVTAVKPDTQYNNMTIYYKGADFINNGLTYYNVSSTIVSPANSKTTPIDSPAGYAVTVSRFNALTVSWTPLSYPGVTLRYDVSANGVRYQDIVGPPFSISGLAYDTSYNIAMYAYDYVAGYQSATQTIIGRTAILSVSTPIFTRIPNSNTGVNVSWDISSTTGIPNAVGRFSYSINNGTVILVPSVSILYPILNLTGISDISCNIRYTDNGTNTVTGFAKTVFDPSFGTFNLQPSVTPLTVTPTTSVGFAIRADGAYASYQFNSITLPRNITETTGAHVALVANVYTVATSNVPTTSAPVALPNPVQSYITFIAPNTSVKPTFLFPPTQVATSGSNTTIILLQIIAGTGSLSIPAFNNTTDISDQRSLFTSLRYDRTTTQLTNLFSSSTGPGILCQFSLVAPTSIPAAPSPPSVAPNSEIFPDPYSVSFPLSSAPTTTVNSYVSLINGSVNTLYSTGQVVFNQLRTLPVENQLLPRTQYTPSLYYAGISTNTSSEVGYGILTTASIASPANFVVSGTPTFNSINVSWNAITTYYGKIIYYNISVNGISRYSGPNLSFNITSLTRLQPYDISLYAYDVAYNSSQYWSQTQTISRSTAALTVSTPVIQYVTNSNTSANISWNTSLLTGTPNATGTLTYSINGGAVVTALTPTSPYPINGLTGIADISCSLVYTDGTLANTVTSSARTTLTPTFGISGGTSVSTPLTSTTSSSVGFAIPPGSSWIGNQFKSIVFTSAITVTANVALVANMYTVSTSSLTGLYPNGAVNPANLGAPVSSYLFFLMAGTSATPTIYFPSTRTLAGAGSTSVILLQVVAGSGTISFPTSVGGIVQSNVTSVSYTGTTLTNLGATSVLCQFNLSSDQPIVISTPNVSTANTNPYALQYSVNSNPTRTANSYVALTYAGVSTLYSTGVVNTSGPQTISVPSVLIPNTTYSAIVYYSDVSTNSASSIIPSPTSRLPAPASLAASPSINSIFLSWTRLPYPGRSYIYNISGSGFTQRQVTDVSSTTISGLAPDTPYTAIEVYAYDALYTAISQWSLPSNSVSTRTTTFKASIANTSEAYTSSVISWVPPLPAGYTGVVNYTIFQVPYSYTIPAGGSSLTVPTSGQTDISCTVVYTDVNNNVLNAYARAWNYIVPTYMQNNKRTGLSPFTATSVLATGQSPVVWTCAFGDDTIYAAMTIGSNGTIYAGSTNRSQQGSGVPNGKFHAISPPTSGTTGILKWSVVTGSNYPSSAVGYDGTIYVASVSAKKLYALDPDSGSTKWSFSPNAGIISAPAIGSDGLIYIVADKLYAVDPVSRLSKWSFPASGSSASGSSPVIGSDGAIYFMSGANLYAVNPTGLQRWVFPTTGDSYSVPTIGSDGTIYIGARNGNFDSKFYAISPTGVRLWISTFSELFIYSSVIGPNGTIYVAANEKLYAINPTTGVQQWTFTANNNIYQSYISGSPTIGSDGIIYFASGEKLYAVSPTGALKWSYTISISEFSFTQPISAPVIGSDGTIYCGSINNNLYAFRSLKLNPPTFAPASATSVTVSYTLPSTGTRTLYYSLNGGAQSAISITGSSSTITGLTYPYPYITAYVQYTDTNNNTIVGDAASYGGGWSTAQYNNARTGRSIFAPYTTDPILPVWVYATSSNSLCCAPVLGSNGSIYFATTNSTSSVSTLYSVNGLSGIINWLKPIGNLSLSPLYELTLDASNNVYYINQNSATIVIVNGATGASITTIGGVTTNIYGGIAVDPNSGNIYYGASNGTFYSYTNSGVLNWSKSIAVPNGIGSPPSIDAAGNVYIPTDNFGTVYSYNNAGTSLQTYIPAGVGANLWSSNSYTQYSAAVILNGVLYCSGKYTTSGNTATYQIVFASTISTGAQLWRYLFEVGSLTSAKYFSSCVTDGTYIYVSSSYNVTPFNNSIYAFRAVDGAIGATYNSTSTVSTALTVDSLGNVYYGNQGGSVYAIVLTGSGFRQKFSYTLPNGDYPTGSIIIGPTGTIYVGSNLGYMYAFRSQMIKHFQYYPRLDSAVDFQWEYLGSDLFVELRITKTQSSGPTESIVYSKIGIITPGVYRQTVTNLDANNEYKIYLVYSNNTIIEKFGTRLPLPPLTFSSSQYAIQYLNDAPLGSDIVCRWIYNGPTITGVVQIINIDGNSIFTTIYEQTENLQPSANVVTRRFSSDRIPFAIQYGNHRFFIKIIWNGINGPDLQMVRTFT